MLMHTSLLLSLVILQAASEDNLQPGIAWEKNFKEARQTASKAGKPLLVDFGADWCGFCKKLDRETFGDEAVIRFLRQYFVAVKVDTDAEPELAKEYKVTGLPTVVVLSPGGEELRRVVGFRPPDGFIEEVNKAAQSSEAFQRLKEAALGSPDDAAAQRAYARALLAARNTDEALKVVKKALEKDASHPGLMLELGDILRLGGKLAEASEAYQKLVALPPTAAGEERRKAFIPLARCHLDLGEARKCVTVLDSFIETLRDAPAGGDAPPEKATDRLEARFLRGYAHARLKEADKALEDLKAARDADPQSPWGLRASFIIDLVEGGKT